MRTLLLWPLLAWTLLAGPQAQASTPPPSPQDQMLETARQWVAQSQRMAAAQVRFAALDSRVQVARCEQPLQLDYPFPQSRETVRVRCATAQPWQLFLRVLPSPQESTAAAPASTAPPPTPASAPSASAAPEAVAMKSVVLTRRLVQRGTVLEPSMLEVVERPAQGLEPQTIGSLKDVEAAEVLRDIPAGTLLRSYDIKRALMVRRGQTALLTIGQGSGFQITVRVEAQQDGYMGEQIRLKNTESGRLLSGVVTGPNAVRGL